MSASGLMGRYVAALSLLGIFVVAGLVWLGLVQGLWIPLLITIAVISAQLGRGAGLVALWAPLIVGVIWAVALAVAVTLGYDTSDADDSAGWAALFGIGAILSLVIAAEVGVIVGLVARRKAVAATPDPPH